MSRTRKYKAPPGRDYSGRREGNQGQCAGTGTFPKRITHRKERQRGKRIAVSGNDNIDPATWPVMIEQLRALPIVTEDESITDPEPVF
mgnify:CR=1 FL=1